MTALAFILGIFLGAAVGFFAFVLLASGSREDAEDRAFRAGAAAARATQSGRVEYVWRDGTDD